MMNLVVMTGRLCRDPELRYTPANTAVCQIRIAVERDYAEKDGTKKADFFNAVYWAHEAEFVSRYFTKGQMITVAGSLQTRDYTGKAGQKVYVTEIKGDKAYFAGGQKLRDVREEDPEDPRDDTSLDMATERAGSFREICDEDGELPF